MRCPIAVLERVVGPPAGRVDETVAESGETCPDATEPGAGTRETAGRSGTDGVVSHTKRG
jgi:hypothetical protein